MKADEVLTAHHDVLRGLLRQLAEGRELAGVIREQVLVGLVQVVLLEVGRRLIGSRSIAEGRAAGRLIRQRGAASAVERAAAHA